MGGQLGYGLAHACVLAICAPLAGAFYEQFAHGEMPCPLCILQRMGMMLCGLGPAYVLCRARAGEVTTTDLATGYGMSVIAALAGGSISARHILLHIVPPDPGFGKPVLGLHLYTWAFIVFAAVILVSGIQLMLARELTPGPVRFGWPSRLVLLLFGAIIAANLIAVFLQEGLHWTLPDEPERYQLLDDLGWR